MEEIKFCKKHGNTIFVLDSEGTWRCRKCRREAVQKRREKLKLLAIEYKGGKCEICGYDSCPDALEFHHVNPSEKEFGISKNGNTRSFESIKKELDKCILVCSNCHREIHYNLRTKETNKIIEEIAKEKELKDSKKIKITKVKKEKVKEEKQKNTKKRTIPTKEEVITLLKETKNFSEAGRLRNVSDNAVRKWCKKYGIPIHTKKMIQYLADF